MAKHMTCIFAAWSVVAVLCAALDGLAVPAFCVESIVGETQKAVETPKSGETQKPGGTEKTDDAKKTDEPSQTGKTDESGEATEIKVDLTKLSIEELMNVEVTIASKKPESVLDTPSAVYVLTGEDIKRSGATTIPDALRLVPGVEVANINANIWAVGCRGFNDEFSNKLLVLIDGRSVYNALYSGVYWDVQDVVLEDVDRIEVIRGPGATMWGANAVNGVIDIITKSAADTQGTLIAETVGSATPNITVVRQGGKVGKTGHFRVFGKYFIRGPFVYANGNDANDQMHLAYGGFRTDWDASSSDQITLQGDIYNSNEHAELLLASLSPPFESIVDVLPFLAGWNLLGRWTRVSDKTDVMLQMYLDNTRINAVDVNNTLNTFDIDFQQHSALSRRHDIIWGLGYRLISSRSRYTFTTSLSPADTKFSMFSVFAQDEMTLVPNRFRLTLGSKFENNYFTGFEIQPTIRFLWTPDNKRSIWAAVSRAVRTPSIIEEDGRLNLSVFPDQQDPNLIYLVSVFGNPDFLSDELVAYELGYRTQAKDRLSLDFAGFYNIYQKLETANPGALFFEPSPPHVVIPYYFGNSMHGHSYGFEMSADWRPRDWWRIVAGYSYLSLYLRLSGDAQGIIPIYSEGQDPRNQFFLRSSINLPGKVQLDTIFRYVDKLPSLDVPSYFELDVRLAWHAKKDIELALVGQNLLQKRHKEFGASLLGDIVSDVPRSVYGTITWKL